MFKRQSHFKIMSMFLLAFLALFSMFALIKGHNTAINAESENAKIALRVGPSVSSYTGYKRYEGIIFNANGAAEDLTFTSSDTTAFVFKVKVYNSASTAYAFYLNGLLNTGTNASPTQTSLYKDATYVKDINHGSYSVGYYNNQTDFNYIVVPTTNFSSAAADTSVTVQNVAIAVRLQGIASNKIEYATANMDVFGIYLATDFTKESDLNLAGLKTIYTPAADSLGKLDALHVEEGVVPVHLVPEVVEHVDGIRRFVFFHEGALARGEGQGQKAENDDM